MNDEEFQGLMCGMMLGDGCFELHGKDARYREYKKAADVGVLRREAQVLKRFGFSVYVKPEKRTGGYTLSTRAHPELTKIWRRWYPTGKGGKVLCVEDAWKLNPLGLAVWYMHDGSLVTSSLHCRIATHCFSRKEVEILKQILDKKFGISLKIRSDRSYYSLESPTIAESKKLLKIVEPFIVSCMWRKLMTPRKLEQHRKYLKRVRPKCREWYQKNKDKYNQRRRERRRDPEYRAKDVQRSREYHIKNRDEINQKRRERYADDLGYREEVKRRNRERRRKKKSGVNFPRSASPRPLRVSL